MRSMSCHSENIEPVSGILALSTPTPPSPLMSSYLLFLPSPFPPQFAKIKNYTRKKLYLTLSFPFLFPSNPLSISSQPALITRISCEDQLFFYMRGIDCSVLGTKHIFIEHPVSKNTLQFLTYSWDSHL